ncbi:SEL1-like repeat protein [Caulobacter sp. 17J65-9]|uniref:SEL1-like repeat protein n=1 Tax=Caulobacter sp. 17J65-9 TaxID=2709382 RepID=UPI0013C7EFDB|nr:SEL1-like repeat protein [Caulobacter sp. 17J65-9]NEX93225.1 hypothetical protein [Caulobacter sp. 17J65-9]
MSAGAPWSVKGIDPKAREIAKDLARRSGMTLGEWLNQMILEGDGEEDNVTPLPRRTVAYAGFDRRARGRRLDDSYDLSGYDDEPAAGGNMALALEALTARIEAAERRSTLAISGVSQAVNGLLGRLEDAEAGQAVHTEKLGELLGDARDSNDRLRRLERDTQGGLRSTEALKALEGALGKIANQLYEGEARTRASLAEVRENVGGVTRRLTRLEAEERAGDATLIDGAVAKIAERLERAESQTAGALRTLETSFAHLDARLRSAEGRMDPERDARLENLAGDLSRKVEDARSDLIRRIDEAASKGRFEQLERAVGDLAAHVGASEKRSAKAVEQMGREVLRIGQNLNRRMVGVETASAAAVQKAGADVQRLADAMEGRLRRVEGGQGEALERLGAEIARISERFTEKLAHAERRSALQSDDVGERVGRLADKVEARYERVSGEIAERIRESEERTARLLDEARLKIEAQLDQQARRRRPEPEEPVWAPEPEAAFPAAAGSDMGFDPIFDAPQTGFGDDAAPEFGVDPFAPAADERAPLSAFDDFAAEDEFVAAPAPQAAQPFADEEEAAPARPPVSTREAIEAARAAARLGVRNVEGGGGLSGLKLGSKNRLQERVEKERKRESSTVKKALLASAVAATLTSSVVAYQVVATETNEDEAAASAAAAASTPLMAAVATAPDVTIETTPAADANKAEETYADAKAMLTAKDPRAMEVLERAANLGSPEAQYHLADVIEERDPAAARRWTERSAKGGYSTAMHALATYYANGIGGPRDTQAAIGWFKKAAELGYKDSYYNLGLMYDALADQRDPVEAYKWFLVGAHYRDAQAETRADELETELSLDQRRRGQREAAAFRPANEPVEIAAR